MLSANLRFLRVRAGVTQADMAAALEVSQGYVSKLERQNDMMISTLQAYVRVLGGTVEIRARMGDSEDLLYQFDSALPPRRGHPPS